MTGDEIISDTFDLKEIDDAVYEVDCKKVTRGIDKIGLSSRFYLAQLLGSPIIMAQNMRAENHSTDRHWRQSIGRRGRRSA